MKKGIEMILSIFMGIICGGFCIYKYMDKKRNEVQQMSNKHLKLYLMMNKWVKIKQNGNNIDEYFTENGYKNIAIYGMNYVGDTLLKELKDTSIVVKYGIDKNADKLYSTVDILKPDDDIVDVDCVVVTPVFFFDEIYSDMSKKVSVPIISMEDILETF